MLEVQSLIGLSEDDLLEQLGRQLWSETSHALPATRQSLKSLAREWLKTNLPEAKDAVCGNSIVDAIRRKADEVTLAGRDRGYLRKRPRIPRASGSSHFSRAHWARPALCWLDALRKLANVKSSDLSKVSKVHSLHGTRCRAGPGRN